MSEEEAQGFRGLMVYANDADAAIAAADRIAAGPAARNPQPAAATPVDPTHRDAGAIAGGVKKVVGWVIGIGLLFAVKAGIFGVLHAFSGGGTTSSYSQAPATSPGDVNQGASDAGAGAAPVATSNWSDVSAPSIGDQAPSSPPVDDDGSSISKPVPGTETLTMPELRYCLAEDVRLAAQKSMMDEIHLSDVERFNRNVDGFNESVEDYNGRCRNRMFVSSQKPLADSQIEAQRSTLESEGTSRVD